MSEVPYSKTNSNIWQTGPNDNLSAGPIAVAHPIKKNNSILGKTLDIKISHKTRILPNQIKIVDHVRRGGYQGFWASSRVPRSGYVVVNTVTGKVEFLTYYEISRYYLGKSFFKYKTSKVLSSGFPIMSNPKVLYKDLYIRKYDLLGNVRRRMWRQDGLTEDQIKIKEEEIKNNPKPTGNSYTEIDKIFQGDDYE